MGSVREREEAQERPPAGLSLRRPRRPWAERRRKPSPAAGAASAAGPKASGRRAPQSASGRPRLSRAPLDKASCRRPAPPHFPGLEWRHCRPAASAHWERAPGEKGKAMSRLGAPAQLERRAPSARRQRPAGRDRRHRRRAPRRPTLAAVGGSKAQTLPSAQWLPPRRAARLPARRRPDNPEDTSWPARAPAAARPIQAPQRRHRVQSGFSRRAPSNFHFPTGKAAPAIGQSFGGGPRTHIGNNSRAADAV